MNGYQDTGFFMYVIGVQYGKKGKYGQKTRSENRKVYLFGG